MLPITLSITIDRADARTLPVQLADRIRSAIDAGELKPDSRLPSTRALSVDLGIARAVVEKAYEQLVAEGWLDARRGSGNYVRHIPVHLDRLRWRRAHTPHHEHPRGYRSARESHGLRPRHPMPGSARGAKSAAHHLPATIPIPPARSN